MAEQPRETEIIFQFSHGGSLPSSVVAEERGDLPLVELQVEVVDGQFGSLLVDFHQVSDTYAQHQVSGF